MRDHYVYFIQERCPERKKGRWAVKIGVAQNVDQRLRELQTGNPSELYVRLKFGPFTKADAFRNENWFHRKFKPHRIRGEWFTARVLGMIDINKRSA